MNEMGKDIDDWLGINNMNKLHFKKSERLIWATTWKWLTLSLFIFSCNMVIFDIIILSYISIVIDLWLIIMWACYMLNMLDNVDRKKSLKELLFYYTHKMYMVENLSLSYSTKVKLLNWWEKNDIQFVLVNDSIGSWRSMYFIMKEEDLMATKLMWENHEID